MSRKFKNQFLAHHFSKHIIHFLYHARACCDGCDHFLIVVTTLTVQAGFSPHRIPRPGSQISTAAEPWQYNLYEAHGPCTKFSEPRTKTTRHDTKKPLSGSGKIRWRHSGGNLAAQNQPARGEGGSLERLGGRIFFKTLTSAGGAYF